MVSDEELVDRLRDILRSSDLDTTTAGAVRRRLEQEFGVDLYGRRGFIREQIDLFLDTHVAAETKPLNDNVLEQEDKEEEEEEEEKEEEENEKEDEHGNGGSLKEEEEEDQDEDEEEEEEEEESDEDDKTSKKRSSGKVEKDASRKRSGGFSKVCALSPQLQELVGEPELARTEVVKRIWAYIREKNLQNPKNKRKILCDETLRRVFRVNTIDMFQMNKALTKHIWPIDEEEAAPVKPLKKEKQQKRSREDEPKRKEKRRKGGNTGFLAPLPLSDALVKFFGTGEIELSRADVIKRMWQYIKENELQDPSDKRIILCDDKLKELFEVDSFHGFTVSKLLVAHFVKSGG